MNHRQMRVTLNENMAGWSDADWRRFIEERGLASEGLVFYQDDTIVLSGDTNQPMFLVREDGTRIILEPKVGQAKPEEERADYDIVLPKHAEFLGALFIKPEMRDHLLGDRAEAFARDVKRFGRKRAVFLYWWDIAASLRAPLWALLKRAAGLTALADLYKRFTGG